jgi:putative flippase GtrA
MIERYVPERHREIVGQLVRYGLNGVVVTGLYSAVMTGGDSLVPGHIQSWNLAAFLVSVVVGYNLHSRITFKGRGERGGQAQLRFFLAALPSYAVNAFWTWLLGTALHLPHWTIQLPIWFVTPFMIFAINRWWVFK